MPVRKRFRIEEAFGGDMPISAIAEGDVGPMHREIMAELRAIRTQMAGAGHLGTDGPQFGHDLAMQGTDIAFSDRRYRHVAAKCFFDTKTFANRHENFPDLHSLSFRQMRFNIGFTPGPVVKSAQTAAHHRLTMRARHSLKINATGQNRAELTTW